MNGPRSGVLAGAFNAVECFDLVREADVIISVPKLKTHDQTEMTCSIKKLKGLLSDKLKGLCTVRVYLKVLLV